MRPWRWAGKRSLSGPGGERGWSSTAKIELVLSGEFGDTPRMMMEMLVALGKVFGAERMVPIRSAQVSGASYKTIGKYGLEWLNTLKARVAVPTVLNPVGMDRERWRDMGISPGFAKKQAEVINAYDRLGVRLESTCTPVRITRSPGMAIILPGPNPRQLPMQTR